MPQTDVFVDPANADALKAWDGIDGAYWAENEAVFERSLSPYNRWFFEAAAIGPEDRVLDIGCGNGGTTREAARRASSGFAVGIDLSSQMLDRARRRSADDGLTNVRFVQGDAQVYPFEPASFDLAISRTGSMFFADPFAAFANVAAALRPDGRLVLLVWQSAARNDWIREFGLALAAGRTLPAPPPGAPGPLSLAEPERVKEVLSGAGFTDIALTDVSEPMHFGDDVESAYGFVRGLGFVDFMLKDLDEDGRRRALGALRSVIEQRSTPEGVFFASAAWVVSARRA